MPRFLQGNAFTEGGFATSGRPPGSYVRHADHFQGTFGANDKSRHIALKYRNVFWGGFGFDGRRAGIFCWIGALAFLWVWNSKMDFKNLPRKHVDQTGNYWASNLT